MQLSVDAWQGQVFDINSDQTQFGLCVQADIVINDSGNNPLVLESKEFDFVVNVEDSSFNFDETDILSTNAVTTDNETGEVSGTTVSATWRGTNPLAPGQAVWFSIEVDDPINYDFVAFESVTMTIGSGSAENLITGSSAVDSVLTSSELTNSDRLDFYHILDRSDFAGTAQSITFTGKATVDYNPSVRKLRGLADDVKTATESDFEIRALLSADNGEEIDTSSGTGGMKIVSLVVSTLTVGAAALI